MNITDIEDKIINKANADGQDPLRLANEFADDFLNDMKALGINSVNLYAKASEHVSEIIAQISTLIDKGYAYQIDGDIFYDVSRFKDYGELSGQDIKQLVMHRIDPDPRKKNAIDFALWKSQKPGEPAWESPWGKGRPGWHIEDTAITTTYFGPSYDLHGGGLDLVFPHHEAEIAQAEAATGIKPLVKYWIHSGLLTVSGTRMGKSMGNFITIKEALTRHEPESLRLYFAMSHYRSQLEFSEENIVQAEQVLERIRSNYNQFLVLLKDSEPPVIIAEFDAEIRNITSSSRLAFNDAMDDDFNTPRALAAIIAYSKNVTPYLNKRLDKTVIQEVVQTFDYFGNVFGILQSKPSSMQQPFEKLIEKFLIIRDEARRREDWKTSDDIRNSLASIGVIIEDTPNGTKWHVKTSAQAVS
jgi:cysteinyl-tRNA synthetase